MVLLDHLFDTIPPSVICYYTSQHALQLTGSGRRSSDVTVGSPPLLFLLLEIKTRLPRDGGTNHSGEETHTWVSFILLNGQTHEKLNELKPGRFSKETKFSSLFLLQSTADCLSYFSPFEKGEAGRCFILFG
ncbi:hypothetical protein AMECASPLE_029820 [Ameca splendens]|uniref:Uncharacterized protein n=1 Tax=Ameca splendens TaxID=208324 RepID=A0ABV1A2A6_9TELE